MKSVLVLLSVLVFSVCGFPLVGASQVAGSSLQAPLAAPVAQDTGPILAVDLNGDGRSDLVTLLATRPVIGVLLGNGDGSFRNVPGPTLQVNGRIEAGDVDGDGRVDLLTMDRQQVAAYLGNGDGTFRGGPTTQFRDGLLLTSYVARLADFDNDSRLDLVLIFRDEGFFLKGRGDGGFDTAEALAQSFNERVFLGDFDEDANVDIVSTGNRGPGVLLLGNGDGTFRDPIELPGYVGNELGATGDVNGDGHLDVIAATRQSDHTSSSITTLLGNGDGTFSVVGPTPTVGLEYVLPSTADIDRDGLDDVLAVRYCGNVERWPCEIEVIHGRASGELAEWESYFGGLPLEVVNGDFDGDAAADLVSLSIIDYSPRRVVLSVFLSAEVVITNARAVRRGERVARVTLDGANFDPAFRVLLGDALVEWPTTKWKSARRVVLRGPGLEEYFAPGMTTTIRVVNPDGRSASVSVGP